MTKYTEKGIKFQIKILMAKMVNEMFVRSLKVNKHLQKSYPEF